MQSHNTGNRQKVAIGSGCSSRSCCRMESETPDRPAQEAWPKKEQVPVQGLSNNAGLPCKHRRPNSSDPSKVAGQEGWQASWSEGGSSNTRFAEAYLQAATLRSPSRVTRPGCASSVMLVCSPCYCCCHVFASSSVAASSLAQCCHHHLPGSHCIVTGVFHMSVIVTGLVIIISSSTRLST
jgi:hypothetical protein